MDDGQIEMIGLVMIVITLVIIFLFFLSFPESSQEPTTENRHESYADNLMPSMLEQTTHCENKSLRDLIKACNIDDKTNTPRPCTDTTNTYCQAMKEEITQSIEWTNLTNRLRFDIRIDRLLNDNANTVYNTSFQCNTTASTYVSSWRFDASDAQETLRATMHICP